MAPTVVMTPKWDNKIKQVRIQPHIIVHDHSKDYCRNDINVASTRSVDVDASSFASAGSIESFESIDSGESVYAKFGLRKPIR